MLAGQKYKIHINNNTYKCIRMYEQLQWVIHCFQVWSQTKGLYLFAQTQQNMELKYKGQTKIISSNPKLMYNYVSVYLRRTPNHPSTKPSNERCESF